MNTILITSALIVVAVLGGCIHLFNKYESAIKGKYDSLEEDFQTYKWHLTEFGLIKYYILSDNKGFAWVVGENFMGQQIKIKGFTQKPPQANMDDAEELLRVLENH